MDECRCVDCDHKNCLCAGCDRQEMCTGDGCCGNPSSVTRESESDED